MKNIFFSLIFITPFLSFGQLTVNEKKEIDLYATNLCSCVEETISSLGTAMRSYIEVLAEEGMEAAGKYIATYFESAPQEKINQFLADAEKMQDSDSVFLTRIENCENNKNLPEKSISEINNESGESFDYFIKLLSDKDFCKLTKMFYNLGGEDRK